MSSTTGDEISSQTYSDTPLKIVMRASSTSEFLLVTVSKLKICSIDSNSCHVTDNLSPNYGTSDFLDWSKNGQFVYHVKVSGSQSTATYYGVNGSNFKTSSKTVNKVVTGLRSLPKDDNAFLVLTTTQAYTESLET
jgi:hypothetical protein